MPCLPAGHKQPLSLPEGTASLRVSRDGSPQQRPPTPISAQVFSASLPAQSPLLRSSLF